MDIVHDVRAGLPGDCGPALRPDISGCAVASRPSLTKAGIVARCVFNEKLTALRSAGCSANP